MRVGIAAHPLELAVALGLLGMGALAPDEAEAKDDATVEQAAGNDSSDTAEAKDSEVP